MSITSTRARATPNPWLIAMLMALASFMEVLDTTIANVALKYIAGGLGVSEDEASWVITTYLVANAVIVTATSFLVRRMGRKTFFLICLGLFTVSSVLCGFATNLQMLLFCRILQGLGGGGMVPVAQSIIADSFPPEKRSQGFALFSISMLVAPIVGPTLGGWLSDNWSWHWCFLINGPIGALAIAATALLVPESQETKAQWQHLRLEEGGFDWIGFTLAATFLGALEIVLDRGLVEDWFGSSFIRTVAMICLVALLFMIPWEIRHRHPAVDVRMLTTRQFGACFLVSLAAYGILMATTQFLPQLVQGDFGYTATLAGLMLSPGGLVAMVEMFIVGQLAAKVQAKYLIAAGAAIVAASMYVLTNVYSGLDFWYFVRARMLLSVGLPLITLPVMAAAYYGLPPSKTDQASALLNAGRNIAGSIGISLISNVLARREQFHRSRLVEHAIPSSGQYQGTLQHIMDYFVAQGSDYIHAQQQAIGWMGQQIQTQSSFLAYSDAFWLLTLVSLAAVPLSMSLRNIKLKGSTSSH